MRVANTHWHCWKRVFENTDCVGRAWTRKGGIHQRQPPFVQGHGGGAPRVYRVKRSAIMVHDEMDPGRRRDREWKMQRVSIRTHVTSGATEQTSTRRAPADDVCSVSGVQSATAVIHTTCVSTDEQRQGRSSRGGSGRCGAHNRRAFLLSAVLLACGWSFGRAKEAGPLHIRLDEMPAVRQKELGSSRRQAPIQQHDSAHPLRCATATVQRPTIGQCIEVFAKPVPLRVCVHNESEAQDRVDLPLLGPRAR